MQAHRQTDEVSPRDGLMDAEVSAVCHRISRVALLLSHNDSHVYMGGHVVNIIFIKVFVPQAGHS